MASTRANFLLTTLWFLLAALAGLALTLAGVFLYLDPQIPKAESYREVRLETPLRIYTSDGALMGEFGERRVIPVDIEDVPQQFISALLDTEDKRFYEHSGIDYISLANDTLALLLNREIRSGASTITMQVSRNISFSLEQTFIRKFKEMLLALKIERELSKDEILELYVNAVPFGKRAYGAQAAAYTYYGKPLHELRLAQLAMLAGVPQAPSKGNPINGPERALKRRNLVLARMRDQESISQQDYDAARAEPISARLYERDLEAPAAFAAEWVRQQLKRYPDLYSAGYIVYTTIERDKQLAATAALRDGLEAYDQKHGYRGPEAQLQPEEYAERIAKTAIVGSLHPAVVLAVSALDATLLLDNEQQISIGMPQFLWARPYESVNVRGPEPTTPADVVAVGDLVRVRPVHLDQLTPEEQEAFAAEPITEIDTTVLNSDDPTAELPVLWRFSQVPEAQGALVSVDPNNGSVLAMEGGYDFALSQFNHALQATRQPGSGFKPFVYSAALANDVTPASLFMDAPLVFKDDALETEYRPDNDNNRYNGPTRLREALYRSINLVSMRVMLEVGAGNVLEHVNNFGFATNDFPRDTQLAIGGGTMAVTPLQMAKAYGVFANGGFDVAPYIIERVETLSGELLQQANPQVVCTECESLEQEEEGETDDEAAADAEALAAEQETEPTADPEASSAEEDAEPMPRYAPRMLDERNAYVVNTMLQDVIKRGTGRRALVLEREDIAGKTGTTNDGTDTWFNGYNANNVTTVWVGFSNYDPLGARAYGGNTALPIWIDYMAGALNDSEPGYRPQPSGVVVVKIDPETGEAATPQQRDAIFEYFFAENAPQIRAATRLPIGVEDDEEINAVELF
ncbi:MAG: penicillin-binding protein 1A [Pseudomonadales bacterium]